MKALKFYKNKGIVLRETDIPQIKTGELLVKVDACSICGSDARILKGEKQAKEGVTLGHEVAGTVVETRTKRHKTGEKVAIFPSYFCKVCRSCEKGAYNLCENKKSIGYYYDGGFAEYIKIPKDMVSEGAVIKIDDEYDPVLYSLTEPFACVLSSFDIMRKDHIKDLLIVGAGPLGLMHLIASVIFNIETVTICDPHPQRREKAKIIREDVNVLENALDYKSKADAIAVCAFVPDIIDFLIEKLHAHGVLNLFAGGKWESKSLITPNAIHYKEKIITGTHSTTLSYFTESIEFVSKFKEKFYHITTHTFRLEDYNKAFQTYITKKGLKVTFVNYR